MEIRWLCIFIIILLTLCDRISTQEIHERSKTSQDKQIDEQSILADETVPEEFIDEISNQPHSRKKRLIWVTDDGRLALPPGTSLTMTPTIAMPLVRYPPEGFLSNITISLPVTMDFDKLGLTDNQNPLGVLPPIFARSFGKAAGSMLSNYISDYMHYRKKRDVSNDEEDNERKFKINISPSTNSIKEPKLPDQYKHVFLGGERALLYGVVEDFLATFGMNGKACVLRTICEVHSKPLYNFGFLGELVKLFFTATNSPYSEHIPEYVKAQEIGQGKAGPGECFPYYKECPKGLFRNSQPNKYSESQDHESMVNQKLDNISPQSAYENLDNSINNMNTISM